MILKNILCCSVLSLIACNALCFEPVEQETSDVSVVTACAPILSATLLSEDDPKFFENPCPSLMLIKMCFEANGLEFKPLPEGLNDDITMFFTKFNPGNYFPMGEQNVVLDEQLITTLHSSIVNEQREWLKGRVTFYHGCDGKVLFLYMYYAKLFGYLTGKDLGEFLPRGDHLYARNSATGEICSTIQEVSKGKSDYKRGMEIITLHCNAGLSVGPGTSLTTASAVGFLCNAFNAHNFKAEKLLEQTLILQGMSQEQALKYAKEFQSLLKKYFPDDSSNGGLIAISLPVKEVDKFALHVCVGGTEYDPRIAEIYNKVTEGWASFSELGTLCDMVKDINESTPIDAISTKIKSFFWCRCDEAQAKQLAEELLQYRRECSKDHASISKLLDTMAKASVRGRLNMEEVCSLTNEIILYLHPELHKFATISGVFRHPFEKPSELTAEIDELAYNHALELQKLKPIERAFFFPRALPGAEEYSNLGDVVRLLIARGEFEIAKKLVKENSEFKFNSKLLLGGMLQAMNKGYGVTEEIIKEFIPNCSENAQEMILMASHYPEGLEQGQHYRKLFQYFRQQDLDDEAFFRLISLFPHKYLQEAKEDLLETAVKQRVEQKGETVKTTIAQRMLQEMNPFRMASKTIIFLMNLGCSFNPKDTEGARNLKQWLEICKRNPDLLLSSIKYILDKGYLDADESRKLMRFWANNTMIHTAERDDKDRVCVSVDNVRIPIDELMEEEEFNIPVRGEDAKQISESLTKRFKRPYSTELVQAFIGIESYSIGRISYTTAEQRRFDSLLSAITNLSELDKLMDKLDNLDILFFSLKRLDIHPVIIAAATEGKTTPQKFLDKWLIEKFLAYKKQNELMEQSGNVAQFIKESSMNTILHYVRNHVMDVYKHADAILRRISETDKTIFVRCKTIMSMLDYISLLNLDEVKEILTQEPLGSQWGIINHLLSSNEPSCKSLGERLSKEITYPGTSLTFADFIRLAAEYGLDGYNFGD